MIRTFTDKDTEALFDGNRVRRYVNIETVARRKLTSSRNCTRRRSWMPPGNRLEALKGDRAGHYSIRINDQFRVCFRWLDGDALDVEIVDYH